MKGQETVPINETGLAMLLEFYESPINVILGKPKDNKPMKIKNFAQRIQRSGKPAK